MREGAHFEGNKPVISEGEGKTEAAIRTIPIFAPLMNAILSQSLPPRSEFVCCSKHGAQITETAFKAGWKSFLKTISNAASGDEKPFRPGKRTDVQPTQKQIAIRTHDLRHTFCTFLYDAGVDLKTAQAIMGHANIEVTLRIYTHLSREKQEASVAAMHAYFEARMKNDVQNDVQIE